MENRTFRILVSTVDECGYIEVHCSEIIAAFARNTCYSVAEKCSEFYDFLESVLGLSEQDCDYIWEFATKTNSLLNAKAKECSIKYLWNL